MAFGFTPKFEEDFYLDNLTPEQYLVIALEAANQLKWDINYKSKSGFITVIGGGLFSSTEEFKLVIQDSSVAITSKNLSSGMYDWGKNKTHVEDFLSTFENIKSPLTDQELEKKVDEIMPPLREQEQDILIAPPETIAQKFRDAFSIFTPTEGYYITPIIIDINLLVFVLMIISGVSIFTPTTDNLIAWVQI